MWLSPVSKVNRNYIIGPSEVYAKAERTLVLILVREECNTLLIRPRHGMGFPRAKPEGNLKGKPMPCRGLMRRESFFLI